MSNANTQATSTVTPFPLAVYNAGATAIPANSLVIIDASNILDNAGTNNQIAVTLPTGTTTPSRCIGVTLSEIPAYDSGTISGFGPVCRGICKGAITAGSEVANSIASGYTGNIATAVANYPSCGIALMTGADTDVISFMACHSGTTITGSTMGT